MFSFYFKLLVFSTVTQQMQIYYKKTSYEQFFWKSFCKKLKTSVAGSKKNLENHMFQLGAGAGAGAGAKICPEPEPKK